MTESETAFETLEKLVRSFDSNTELVRSDAYGDGGTSMLFPRLERAALNQLGHGEATFSRYAIWANTLRDYIGEAIRLVEAGDVEGAKELLVEGHNSLGAFAEVQKFCDPLRGDV